MHRVSTDDDGDCFMAMFDISECIISASADEDNKGDAGTVAGAVTGSLGGAAALTVGSVFVKR